MNQKILDPQVRDLAQRLLAYEVASVKVSEENTLAVFRVSERLRRPLSTLAGTSGFSALLARALVLT